MTDKDRAILKDRILKSISLKEKDCKAVALELNQPFELVWTLSEDIAFDGFLHERDYSSNDGDAKGLSITQRGKSFVDQSSYLSDFKRSRSSEKRKQRAQTAKTVITIGIAILSIIVNIIFSYLNYQDKQEIKDLKKQIEILKKE